MKLDLRLPIGLMFSIFGVLLLGFGLISDAEIYQRSLGINVNLWWGMVLLVFGLVMQYPIVLVLLSKVGIVNAERLRRGRRYVFVGIFVLAVVVTPGGDPISPTITALVMYPLYEVTIWLVARSERHVASTTDAPAAGATRP